LEEASSQLTYWLTALVAAGANDTCREVGAVQGGYALTGTNEPDIREPEDHHVSAIHG
jgi:hypothetical protein